MSTTDNAFIKVYQRGQIENSARDPWQQIVQPPNAGFVTTADTGTPIHNPVPAPDQDRPAEIVYQDQGHDARPPHVRQPGSTVSQEFQRRARTTSREPLGPNVWLDAPHPSPQAPHIRVERYAKGPSVRTLPPRTLPQSETRFSPAWEVDRFNWPAICSDIQDCWIGPLNTVVRSIIRQAWQGGNVVAVTQAVRGEGATTLALCLSRIAAAFQIPVALLDGHRHNSGVATALRLHFEQGWDQTSPTCPFEESAIRSLEDGLVVLPIRAEHPQQEWEVPADLRAALLDELSSSFELVVVDMGPMFVAAHDWFRLPLAGKIGCALVVRDVRTTEPAQTEDVCHRLRTTGVQNVSIIENFQIA